MTIGKLISADRVLCNAEARSKKHALEILSELLADTDPPISPSAAFQSLTTRERLGSTGVNGGAAVPHGRIANLEVASGAVLKLSTPIPFDTPDGKPVWLLFGLVVPQECTDEHIADLASIAAMLRDVEFREVLHKATSSRSLHDLIVEYDQLHRVSA